MQKSLSLLFLSTSLFTACDEAKQVENSNENGRLQGEQNEDFSNLDSMEKLKLRQVRSHKFITIMMDKYQLDENSKDDLKDLSKELQCLPMGIMVGKTYYKSTDEGSHGEWKMNSYYEIDEIVSQDRGFFEITSDDQGELFSDYGDSIMKGKIEGNGHYFEMVGKWKSDNSHGEMIGIKIEDDRENIFGIWSACE